MGICVSRSKRGNAAARPVRPSNSCRPQESPISIPEPRLDQNGSLVFGEEHDLDRQALEYGLELMAKYIHRQDQELAVIIIRGPLIPCFCETNVRHIILTYSERTSTTTSAGRWGKLLATQKGKVQAHLGTAGSTMRIKSRFMILMLISRSLMKPLLRTKLIFREQA
jgi:hypothetical protein